MFKINTSEIKIPLWPTPKHKIEKAFKDGQRHATNHYYKEDPNPDWPFGVKSWSVNPYSENRPAAFYSWLAGFSEQWAELVRQETQHP